MLDLVQKHVWTTCINFQTNLQNKNAFFYYCRPRRKHLICLFFFFKSNYASLFFLDLTKKNLLILLPFRKYVIFSGTVCDFARLNLLCHVVDRICCCFYWLCIGNALSKRYLCLIQIWIITMCLLFCFHWYQLYSFWFRNNCGSLGAFM